jgi:1,4-alpha-glucan branching enzyme
MRPMLRPGFPAVLLAAALCTLAATASAIPVTFSLVDAAAGKVCLAGAFNGWSVDANPMKNDGGTWALVIDLPPGSHMYKFVVDGNWRQDAGNPESAPDGYGGNNSVVKVAEGAAAVKVGGAAVAAAVEPAAKVDPAAPAAGGATVPVTFRCDASGAGNVCLAGEFNSWSVSASPMQKGGDAWTLVMNLAPGSYMYKFVVDGNWKQDANNPESAPDGLGGKNSVIRVGAGRAAAPAVAPATTPAAKATSVPATVKPATGGTCSVTFSHAAPGAGKVCLAGEFNGWSESANPMANKDGTWTLVMDLAPGSFMYKFVVDGTWTVDPGNENTADDGFGGKNSVAKVPAGKDRIDAAATGGAAAPAEAIYFMNSRRR